jgi:hypothetical protein
MNPLRRLYIAIFKPTRVVDSQLMSFSEADILIRAGFGWQLAKTDEALLEENMTWVEKREPITQ